MSATLKLHQGDCVATMRGMPEASVDAIVTDPPYELGFMGKAWDASGIANSVEMWREALRVLKPGGHLLAFSGSRTYHRMVCAIEDAGFDIRDQIMYVYGSGFPKSMNLDRERGKSTCGCAVPYTHDHTESQTQRDLHSMQHAHVPPAVDTGEGRGQVLQPGMPQQGVPITGRQQLAGAEVWAGESGVEGRRDAAQPPRQLSTGSVREMPARTSCDGAYGRVRDGTSPSDGAVVRPTADADGVCAPHQPPAAEERPKQSRTVAGQSQPQAGGAWPICGGCGKPVLPKGLGTALKPAHEPIVVARKPLIGTVAANVLAHGTGALNIDGCRVETTENLNGGAYAEQGGRGESQSLHGGTGMNVVGKTVGVEFVQPAGRWPANLIHDGSAEVLAAFPQSTSGAMRAGTVRAAQDSPGSVCYGTYGGNATSAEIQASSGSAARFFYAAKASKADRGVENVHPTVKPTDLMAYLVRLVTPPGGTVLDPFTGSGSTGKACMREGFDFVGCELSPEYLAIAQARIEHEQLQVAQRAYLDMLKVA